MRKEFYTYLNKLFKEDPRIVILLGDIGVHSFKPSFDYYKSRIYNLGLTEQSIIGVASGLSKQGFIPFIHSIAPFITERCYEQLKIDLGYENVNAFIVSVGGSYDYAALGCSHHCHNDLRIVSAIPNFKTFCPGNHFDVEQIIKDNLDIQRPKYIRLSEVDNGLVANHNYDLLNFDKNGICIVVGNSIRFTDLNEYFDIYDIKCSWLYTYDVSDFNIQKLHNAIINYDIKRKITLIEPCYDSGILTKIATFIPNIESLHHISLPKTFINNYGNKEEIDRELKMDDQSIIEQLKEIYK